MIVFSFVVKCVHFIFGFIIRNTFNSQALRLSGSAKKATTVGEILNLMSVDAQKLQVRHHQGLRE